MKVAVIGAGAMGAGIAQIAAQAGCDVFIYDTREGAAAKAIAGINPARNPKRVGRIMFHFRAESECRVATEPAIGSCALPPWRHQRNHGFRLQWLCALCISTGCEFNLAAWRLGH